MCVISGAGAIRPPRNWSRDVPWADPPLALDIVRCIEQSIYQDDFHTMQAAAIERALSH
jgi:hypothetical protein